MTQAGIGGGRKRKVTSVEVGVGGEGSEEELVQQVKCYVEEANDNRSRVYWGGTPSRSCFETYQSDFACPSDCRGERLECS